MTIFDFAPSLIWLRLCYGWHWLWEWYYETLIHNRDRAGAYPAPEFDRAWIHHQTRVNDLWVQIERKRRTP